MPEEKKFIPAETPVQTRERDLSVEVAPSPEVASRVERAPTVSDAVVVKAQAVAAARQNVAALPHIPKDPVYVEVEHVLEEGMMSYYQGMNPKVQQLFKTRGEELAKTLTEMVQTAHVQLSKVVELIRRWLMLIPGVSRFFLEQEAKIRADRIAMIAQLSAERRSVKR